MQISSNALSPSNSDKNELLNNVILSKEKDSSKISFSVSKQKTTKIVLHNKLITNQDRDEDDEDGDQTRKRGILHLEDGIPIE
jgi:hypothetical protein